MKKIEFFKHNIGKKEIESVTQVLNSLFITNANVTKELEQKICQYLNVQHCIGLTSCTAALHLSLIALNIGPGDEVITTPLTFAASANTILHAGAKPVFIDVEKKTGNMDVNLIEAAITEKTRAILPVHLYGNMCDMIKMKKLADQYQLKIIEDAAHCIEGERDGIKVGQLGDTACFSFYATKNISCGEGGALACHDDAMAELLYKLRLHGINKDAASRYTDKFRQYEIDVIGWKYNISDIQSALLINQLDLIDQRLDLREKLAQNYEQELSKLDINFIKVPANSKSARHLFVMLVENRDSVLQELQNRGIGVSITFKPVHLFKYYRETFAYQEGDFPIAEEIGAKCIALPIYPKLEKQEQEYVIDTVKDIVT